MAGNQEQCLVGEKGFHTLKQSTLTTAALLAPLLLSPLTLRRSPHTATPPAPPVVLTTLWVLANTHQLQFFTKVLFLPFRPPTVPNDQMILAQHPEKGAEFIAA